MTGLVDTALKTVGVARPSAKAASANAVMNKQEKEKLLLAIGL